MTVGELASTEPLRFLPSTPFPTEPSVPRVVAPQRLVHFRGNRYSVLLGLAGQQVAVQYRLGSPRLEVATARQAVVARRERAPDGAGRIVRDEGHVVALEQAVFSSFNNATLPTFPSMPMPPRGCSGHPRRTGKGSG